MYTHALHVSISSIIYEDIIISKEFYRIEERLNNMTIYTIYYIVNS